ncbi:metal ABC transporter solute-binding protein, Zn/Mn family [Paenibacillus sp. FSL R7-0331]|uniref:metal ABC transporter solute-binding protein, Zn/Mn family n=1 Tax=Paenibacillus sp. FSL R7-0331 TaxID=1536773 RepID=UPI0004F788C2|nr:zinc ABC transporter substrate-binding protein [Paenibacillus sp. FSL R7-0331]AIQ53851.1 ABC transporter substrate-binding protein [Paenibacillus sp. FSL R7-0331]
MFFTGLTKKLLLMPALLALLVLTACGAKSGGSIVEGKVNVVTTFYPIYEFTSEIGGDDINAINLLPVGVEPHDWTPRSQDIINTSKSQLFLYNGAGLEGWVPNFLKSLDKGSEVKAVAVSEGVDYIMTDEDDGHNHGGEAHAEDEHAEESHAEDAHEHEHTEDEHADNHAEEAAGDSLHTDPHTWVSPKSALIMAENIKNSLIAADPEHEAGYEERYSKLAERLQALDSKFETELAKLPNKEIVVSHQAFAYLARDYGLSQHAIMGLSPDAEPRGQDLVNLANLVKDEGIKYIFFEELVSDKLAKTLAAEAGVETMVLNPVEGLTEAQEKNGDNYFTLMEKNLQNLILALQ